MNHSRQGIYWFMLLKNPGAHNLQAWLDPGVQELWFGILLSLFWVCVPLRWLFFSFKLKLSSCEGKVIITTLGSYSACYNNSRRKGNPYFPIVPTNFLALNLIGATRTCGLLWTNHQCRGGSRLWLAKPRSWSLESRAQAWVSITQMTWSKKGQGGFPKPKNHVCF